MKASTTVFIVSAFVLAFAMTRLPGPRPAGKPDKGFDAQGDVIISPDDRLRVLNRRGRVKGEVITLLLGGDLRLVEAAARFRDLNSGPPGMEDLYWKGLPGADDGERLCRQVIVWAENRLMETCGPSEVQSRVARLERELRDHVEARGGVELPTEEGEVE